MHFHIRHTTHYRFSAPATLGPHTIRLRPQAAPGLKVTRWSLQVQPHPVGSAEMLDDAGNLVHVVWFAGSTTDLTLLSTPDGGALVRLIAGDLGGHAGPGSTHTPITYAFARVKRAEANAYADAFLTFATGPHAQAVWQRFGFSRAQ